LETKDNLIQRGVLLPGALDLTSFNENLSAFLYNRKSKSGSSVRRKCGD